MTASDGTRRCAAASSIDADAGGPPAGEKLGCDELAGDAVSSRDVESGGALAGCAASRARAAGADPRTTEPRSIAVSAARATTVVEVATMRRRRRRRAGARTADASDSPVAERGVVAA